MMTTTIERGVAVAVGIAGKELLGAVAALGMACQDAVSSVVVVVVRVVQCVSWVGRFQINQWFTLRYHLHSV